MRIEQMYGKMRDCGFAVAVREGKWKRAAKDKTSGELTTDVRE